MKENQTKVVRVIHGINEDWLPLVGLTIALVKRNLREVFNIPYFAEALVDGESVNAEHKLGKCGVLEFAKAFGSKGGDDDECSLETEAEGLFAAYKDDLLLIGENVKSARLNPVESVDMTIRLVMHWCARQFGPICKMDLPDVINTVKQLGHLIQVCAEYQGWDAGGKPGRKETTYDIALFAHVRRAKMKPDSWKEICAAWKEENQKDERVKNNEDIREAHRRHFGDKARS